MSSSRVPKKTTVQDKRNQMNNERRMVLEKINSVNATLVQSGGRRCFGCKEIKFVSEFSPPEWRGEFTKMRKCLKCQENECIFFCKQI